MARKRRSRPALMLERFSLRASKATGTSWAFVLALAVLVVWGISGPLFRFSDTWQLVINTGTTIVTFLMVFLIQRAQNKDALAIHLKLNEIVAAIDRARKLNERGQPALLEFITSAETKYSNWLPFG